MTKVLITGVVGKLGRAICPCLNESEELDVVATDMNFSKHVPVPMTIVDLRNREACYSLLEGIEVLVHCANHPRPDSLNPQQIFLENLAMNVNLFQAAAELGVRKIVFSSSIQVFSSPAKRGGDDPPPPLDLPYLPLDGNIPPNPRNTYGLSKEATECALRYYAKQFGISCISIRYPWLMSKRGARHGRPWFANIRLEEFRMAGDAFAYLMVDDAARLTRAVVEAELPGYRVYQPAAQRPCVDIPVPEIIERVYAEVPLHAAAEKMTCLVDISRITEETGWIPQCDIWADDTLAEP